LMINAYNNHVVAYGNITALPAKMSDLLCRLSTGAGWGTRKLFKDLDEINVSLSRPVLLDGIEDFATRADLIERLVRFHAQEIPTNKRMKDRRFWNEFHQDYPSIFGGLLDVMFLAMRIAPNLNLVDLPRMADFAEWGESVGIAMGLESGRFLEIYEENRTSAAKDRLDSDPVARIVRKFLQENPSSKGTPDDHWKGTWKDLLRELDAVVDDTTAASDKWPKTHEKLSSKMRGLKGGLSQVGVFFEVGEHTRNGTPVELWYDPSVQRSDADCDG
jgi:hypothetical protein